MATWYHLAPGVLAWLQLEQRHKIQCIVTAARSAVVKIYFASGKGCIVLVAMAPKRPEAPSS